jgi:hypothetical protein
MATKTPTERRLTRYVREYAQERWNMKVRVTSDDALGIELRSDGYANAHVEGEHGTEGRDCGYSTARECGERYAAAEFVECG